MLFFPFNDFLTQFLKNKQTKTKNKKLFQTVDKNDIFYG